MRTTFVSAQLGFHRAGAADHPVRAQVPRRVDDARAGDAGGVGIRHVQIGFNWLVDNYPRFADWTASARRAAALLVSLDGLERAESGEASAASSRRDR